MNERIKLLAVEAGAYWREGYVEQPNGANVWQDKAKVDIVDMDLKKFAELIARAYGNIVLHYTDVDEGVKVANKHFGVEE